MPFACRTKYAGFRDAPAHSGPACLAEPCVQIPPNGEPSIVWKYVV
jgi:hypothetical protein